LGVFILPLGVKFIWKIRQNTRPLLSIFPPLLFVLSDILTGIYLSENFRILYRVASQGERYTIHPSSGSLDLRYQPYPARNNKKKPTKIDRSEWKQKQNILDHFKYYKSSYWWLLRGRRKISSWELSTNEENKLRLNVEMFCSSSIPHSF
jgi:hypothetical protein